MAPTFAVGRKRDPMERKQALRDTRTRVAARQSERDIARRAESMGTRDYDAGLVAGLNKAREEAVAAGKSPYSGQLRNYNAYAANNPTVITDATIREKIGPEIQQEAGMALGKYDQNQMQLSHAKQQKEQQKMEQEKGKDPMAGLFEDTTSTAIDPISQKQLDLIDRAMQSQDSSTRLLAEKYKQKFEREREAQTQMAAQEQGNAGLTLQRLGGRYTPGAGGQVQAQLQRANLEKLAEIDDAEISAIEELRLAQENKDLQLMGEKLNVLKGIRDERIAALEDMRKEEKDATEAVNKERNTILKSLGESGAPPDVIAAVSGADSVADMVTAAGSYLQTGEYADYARAVKNAGLTPVDPNTYYSKKIYGEKGAPGSEPFGGDVPFEGTIDAAASFAGTTDTSQKLAREQLKSLAESGDYELLLTRMKNLGRKGMGQTEGDKVFQAENQVAAIDNLQAALDEYEANAGVLGPIPATEKAMAAKLGQLSGDPRFAELATRMTVAFQKYRQAMSGAAFGVQENAQYKSVVPTADKGFDLNRAVMAGLREENKVQVDNAYEQVMGEGYNNLKDYVENGLTPEGKKLLKTEQEAQEYAESLADQDPEFEASLLEAVDAYPEKPYSDILEILGKPVQVGNRVSMAGGNRPQRNNNPGNVKVGGLGDKYAKKGPDGKPMTDDQGHLIFATAEDGARAIRADINAKLSGNSPAAQRKLGRQIKTLADLNAVYAEDPNWKNNVAAFAGVSPDTNVNEIPRETLIAAIMKAEGFFA